MVVCAIVTTQRAIITAMSVTLGVGRETWQNQIYESFSLHTSLSAAWWTNEKVHRVICALTGRSAPISSSDFHVRFWYCTGCHSQSKIKPTSSGIIVGIRCKHKHINIFIMLLVTTDNNIILLSVLTVPYTNHFSVRIVGLTGIRNLCHAKGVWMHQHCHTPTT